jgi:ribosomal protein S18 acetylase RimI-like enzyme
VKIRSATLADAEGISKVHVDSWRTTYYGIVPQDFLDSLTYENRTEQWRLALDQLADRNWIYVAESDKAEIVGFVSCGPIREKVEDYLTEIFAIYLLKNWQEKGIGRRLFEKALKEIKAQGYASMLLWVLEDNPACKFYEKMGGKLVGEKTLEIGGAPLTEIAYGWPVF